MGRPLVWTPERDRRMQNLAKANYMAREIAERLADPAAGWFPSANAVRKRASRLRIPIWHRGSPIGYRDLRPADGILLPLQIPGPVPQWLEDERRETFRLRCPGHRLPPPAPLEATSPRDAGRGDPQARMP